MNEQTRKDTERAASRTRKTEQPKASRFADEFPTFSERELASGLTNTTSGRDDFYTFSQDSKIAREEPQDWGVHEPFNIPLQRPSTAEAAAVEPEFAFALRKNPSGSGYVVLGGSVNTVSVAQYTVTSEPDELWLKVTVDANGSTTAASVETSNPGSDTAIRTSRQIASPTWNGSSLTTAGQGIKGSQNIVSCGSNHGWSSLYL